MKMELLAPVGDFESLKMAVYYGADAIYLGVSKFNARNNIKGFTLENLKEVVNFAHIYGVRVYLAINILFKDEELQEALDVVCEANNMNVDAFIIQDLGLAGLIKELYPNVEIHASTQMAVHNLEGVRILEKLGFSRVVLARETSLDEIKRIRDNSDIEIEFFTQGALCVSFSGNCYMCSHLVGKSGNRGVCQQFCRLPYTFKNERTEKQGFLLSAKDICMLDNLNDLKKAGVCSLKIEGRARRPFYVAQTCKIYRQMIDCGEYSSQDYQNLKIAFNRGYTPAYLKGNENIISKIQGNNGVVVGKVQNVKYGKNFNEVYIKSKYELIGAVGLKFCKDGKEQLSIGAYNVQKTGDLYKFTTTANVKSGWDVHLIQDENLEKSVLNFVRKIDVDIEFFATPNQPIKARAICGEIEIEVEGEICEQSKTISTSQSQILKQMERNEFFKIDKFKCDINNCYILNSSINKLRNNLYQKLIEKILNKYKKIKINNKKINLNTIFKPKTFNYLIINKIEDNFSQINENIIFNYSIFNEKEIIEFSNMCNNIGVKGYLDVPNFATKKDIDMIESVLNKTNLGVVANNLYALNFKCDIVIGQFLNIYNSYTIKALKKLHNFDKAFVEELTERECKMLNTDVGIARREKVYIMTLLHCPFKENVGGSCADCKFSSNATYTMNSGYKFKIFRKKTFSCVFLLKD